jgi:hypothetical protein
MERLKTGLKFHPINLNVPVSIFDPCLYFYINKKQVYIKQLHSGVEYVSINFSTLTASPNGGVIQTEM